MKRRWKTAAAVLCCCSAAVLLAGCSGKKEAGTASKFDDQKEFLLMSNITDADNGVYYIETREESMALKYVDKGSAKETVLCQKVNCRHDSKECPAVAGENEYMCSMVYSNGNLYYMVQNYGEKENGLGLYRMEADGSGKTLVHEFKGQQVPPNGGGIYKGKVFLSLPTMEEEESEDGLSAYSAEPSLVMYDLKTGEERILVDGRKAEGVYTVPCGGSGESIYFYQMSFQEKMEDIITFQQYDLKTRETAAVWSGNEKHVQVIREDTLYLRPEGEKRLEAYHLDTKEKETVLEWEEDYSDVYIQVGFLQFVKREQEEGKSQEFYRWYDLKEKEYLFEDLKAGTEIQDDRYVSEGEQQVKWRLEDGRYWIQKDGKVFLYDPKDKSWTEVKEIN